MPQANMILERSNNLKRFKKNLKHDESCWMCSAFNRKRAGKLVNHRLAGFDDWLTGRHAHAESDSPGLSIEGHRIFFGASVNK